MPNPEATIEEGAEELPVSEADLVADLEYPFTGRGVGEAFERLALKLKDKLLSYDVVLGDDSSGRLISLVLWNLINQARAAEKQKSVIGYFLVGGRRREVDPTYAMLYYEEAQQILEHNVSVNSAIREFLRNKKNEFVRALVVTEQIETGGSILNLTKSLEEQSIDFDVAALSITHPPGEYRKGLSQKLLFGEVGNAGASHFKHPKSFGGVEKGDIVTDGPQKSFRADSQVVQKRHSRCISKTHSTEFGKP